MNAAIRSRLREAVAALSDEELHDRLWLRGERMNSNELTFDDAVLLIIDELSSADPVELIGHVLKNDEELALFLRLSSCLERLVAVIGIHGTYDDAIQSGSVWQDCVVASMTLGDSLEDRPKKQAGL